MYSLFFLEQIKIFNNQGNINRHSMLSGSETHTTTTSRFKSPFQVILAVHDRTADMRLLYISSNIWHILRYQREEMLGQSVLLFVGHGKSQEYKSAIGQNTEHSLLITDIHVVARNGRLVKARVVHFNCDNMAFNTIFVASESVSELDIDGMLTVERISWHGAEIHYDGWKRTVRGCLILEGQSESEDRRPDGPLVIFASKSFERIIEVDCGDVQGRPFLSLVSTEDVARVAMFLEKLVDSVGVIFERFSLRVNFYSDVSRVVPVEAMAAGSVEGVILMCRIKTPWSSVNSVDGGGLEDVGGCVSLDELISSDAETSNFSDTWSAHR